MTSPEKDAETGDVFYNVLRQVVRREEMQGFLGKIGVTQSYLETETDRVRLTEAEIDTVQDGRLKDALKDQLEKKRTQANRAVFIWANPDHTFHHAFLVPTKPLGVEFTAQGIVDLNKIDENN